MNGFHVEIKVLGLPGTECGCPRRFVLRGATRQEADRLLRNWRRPRWLIRAARLAGVIYVVKLDICDPVPERLRITWDQVVEVRVQPEREVID